MMRRPLVVAAAIVPVEVEVLGRRALAEEEEGTK